MKFSIFLPSYNRHALVTKALDSVFAQTYPDFEILFYDNGSNPSLESIVRNYRDIRLKYTRCKKNQNINDLAENSINQMSGSFFLFLADDDALVPNALVVVADVVRKKGIDILAVRFTPFSHIHRTVDLGKIGLNCFTGILEEYDAKEAAYHFCNGWGIGRKRVFRSPRMAHSSGIFISKQLIDKTRRNQRELFIKPFGDIGYVGALLNANQYYFMDAPLAVIGETQIREMNGAQPGQRQKWEKEIKHIEYSPLKGASFVNMGMDAHLKVLYRNSAHQVYDCRLRPSFYKRHLKQVCSDSPWTKQTVRDIAECVPHYLLSILQSIGWKSVEPRIQQSSKMSMLAPFVNEIPEAAGASKTFADINEYAVWVNEVCVKRLLDRKGAFHDALGMD